MANTSVEVITLLSSDEESTTKVESAPSAQTNTKPQKVTARKSTHSKMAPIATVIKEEPPSRAPKPLPTGEALKNAKDAQAKSSNVTEPKKGSVHQGSVTARKSLKNSNCSSAPKVVSSLRINSNSQCASTSSKNETAVASKNNLLSKAAVDAAAKLPGLTVTPLLLKSIKDLQKAPKTCSSQPLPQGTQNFSKHFQPAATSTPKIRSEMLINVGQAISTTARKTFVAKVAKKPNHLRSLAPDATVVSTSSTVSSSSDKISLSISTLARILPDVSICPLTATSSATQNSKSHVPESIFTMLGKAGVSVVKTTKTAEEGKIPETSLQTNSKNKKESQTGNLVKAGMTVTKVLSKAPPVNSLAEESKTSSEIRRPGKAKHKNSVIDSMVASKIIPELKTSNNIKNHEIQSNRNSDASIKKKRLDKVVNSLNVVNNSKVINRDSNTTIDLDLSKTKTALSDPLRTLISNRSDKLPVDVNATRSKNDPNIHKNSTKGVLQNSKGNKRKLFSNDIYIEGVNKKTKQETKSQFNSTHANTATPEENMKRISAIKESLKKMSDKSPRKFEARHDLLQSPDSQSQRLRNNSKAGSALNVPGQKDNVNKIEKSAHTNLNSPKSIRNERPHKQVTSPKLSLKKRSIVEKRPLQKISNEVIPLPYKIKEPSREKAKANSTDAKANTPIPLPYIPLVQSNKKSKLNSTVGDVQSSKVENVTYLVSPSNTNAPSVPPNKKPKLNSTVEDAKLSKTKNVPSASLSSPSNGNKSVVPWESSDSNGTRFKKLLEFSKSFIMQHTPETTPEELKQMDKVCYKVLGRANSSYVDSAEFGAELVEALRKITTSEDTFAFIENLLVNLKARRKTKGTVTPTEPSKLSNSSEKSDTTAFAPKLELPPCESPKEVPVPILGDHLASALHSVTSNLQLRDSSRVHDSYPSVPSTSKQADIVENLRLSMPISNGIRSVSDFRTIPSRQAVDKEDRLSVPAPLENDVLVADIPLTENRDARHVGELEGRGVNASRCGISIEKKGAQPYAQERLGTGTVNETPIVNIRPPMPATAHGDGESSSSQWKSRKIASKNGILIEKQSLQTQGREGFRINETLLVNIQPPTPARIHQDEESNSSTSKRTKIEERVKFLEKYLEKLDKKIKKLQSKELSLDDLDDEDSTYLLEDRYKKKFQKTWVTLCKIKKRSHLVGRAIDKRFSYQGSRHDAFNRAIEKLINKRKPTEKFPNYCEVRNLLKKVNESAHLALDSYEIEKAAKEAFCDIGKELKRRRTLDEEQDFGCYLTDNVRLEADPAKQDEELNLKLSRSVAEGERKIKEIIDKYASEQREDPANEPIDGSDCEEPGANGSAGEEPMDDEDPLDNKDGEELRIGVEAKENSLENTNLPDTDPATPDTDACEDEPETFPTASRKKQTDVIDIDSSSNASTEPGSAAESKSNARSNFNISSTTRIFIDDVVEIAEDNPTNYDDDSSPDLPPLSELL